MLQLQRIAAREIEKDGSEIHLARTRLAKCLFQRCNRPAANDGGEGQCEELAKNAIEGSLQRLGPGAHVVEVVALARRGADSRTTPRSGRVVVPGIQRTRVRQHGLERVHQRHGLGHRHFPGLILRRAKLDLDANGFVEPIVGAIPPGDARLQLRRSTSSPSARADVRADDVHQVDGLEPKVRHRQYGRIHQGHHTGVFLHLEHRHHDVVGRAEHVGEPLIHARLESRAWRHIDRRPCCRRRIQRIETGKVNGDALGEGEMAGARRLDDVQVRRHVRVLHRGEHGADAVEVALHQLQCALRQQQVLDCIQRVRGLVTLRVQCRDASRRQDTGRRSRDRGPIRVGSFNQRHSVHDVVRFDGFLGSP